jgi:hypothetical protein
MMSFKKSSPTSVATISGTERINQGKGRRIDCERELKKIMKDANHVITSSHPTMEGALLGSELIPFEAIPDLINPENFVEKTKISSMITLRVKEEFERTKAITTTKALILGWFHPSLEDYINSQADVDRAKHWKDNDWPKICEMIRKWYMEPITQSTSTQATLAERESMMWEYRNTQMKPTQSVLEFEAEFKSMIEIINDPLQANARKEEVDQAKDFTDKLTHAIFGDFKTEVRAEEDKQQQQLCCGASREPFKGYPQSLAEAVNRAKMVEKQVTLKKERYKNQNNKDSKVQAEKELNLKKERINNELSNFAAVKDQPITSSTKLSTPKTKKHHDSPFTYEEIKAMGKTAKASETGFENCRYCEELNLDSDHIFINCENNPRNQKKRNNKRNHQRNLVKQTQSEDLTKLSNEEITAKMELAYNMGKHSRSENAKANEAERKNFWRGLEKADIAEVDEYVKRGNFYCFMRSMHGSPSIPRPLRRRLQAILDTGSSGNDMPGWLTREIGCTEIENPLKHIPINTVLGQYFCNTISIVPIFGEVSTSPSSNFIILSFDLIQCNPNITMEIKLNERGNALSWVRLTFPSLDGLTILFEFIGRTLIADADELIHALR